MIPVAHHQGDLAQIVALSLEGLKAQHPPLTARRIQYAREHFEGRGFARTIGSEKADYLSGRDLEANGFDGLNLARFPTYQALERGGEPPLAHRYFVGFAQLADIDGGVCEHALSFRPENSLV